LLSKGFSANVCILIYRTVELYLLCLLRSSIPFSDAGVAAHGRTGFRRWSGALLRSLSSFLLFCCAASRRRRREPRRRRSGAWRWPGAVATSVWRRTRRGLEASRRWAEARPGGAGRGGLGQEVRRCRLGVLEVEASSGSHIEVKWEVVVRFLARRGGLPDPCFPVMQGGGEALRRGGGRDTSFAGRWVREFPELPLTRARGRNDHDQTANMMNLPDPTARGLTGDVDPLVARGISQDSYVRDP
jgi:hypothetical protein